MAVLPSGVEGFLHRRQAASTVAAETGTWVINPRFEDWGTGRFSEGLAVVCLVDAKSDRCGYVDRTGKLAISAKFNEADSFSEGVAAVRTRGRWGYIDRTGTLVINPQFDWAAPFSEGLARRGSASARGTSGGSGLAGPLPAAPGDRERQGRAAAAPDLGGAPPDGRGPSLPALATRRRRATLCAVPDRATWTA